MTGDGAHSAEEIVTGGATHVPDGGSSGVGGRSDVAATGSGGKQSPDGASDLPDAVASGPRQPADGAAEPSGATS